MGKRSTVYNKNLAPDEEWEKVCFVNKKLTKDFISYCVANDKSPSTIKQYTEALRIFFVWNLNENLNKSFIDVKKRDLVNFFGHGRIDLQWSSNRLAFFRSALSSLSNYIERILDDEYPHFKNIVKVLEPIAVETVREKTVLSPEQVEEGIRMLTEEGDIQEACWLALLYSSGMRKSEVVQMEVDFFTDENVVFDIMYRTPKIRTKGRGTKGKQVPRYIFKYTFEPFLKRWLEEREKLGITCKSLFVVKHGGEYIPATITTMNSWAQRMSKKLNVEFYSHAMRHCWTTKLKNGGYPIDVIQKLQHWASSDMVLLYDDTTEEQELESFFQNFGNKE